MYNTKVVWEDALPILKGMGLEGYSMSHIAREFGVSRQRIKQVVKKYIPDWNIYYGRVAKRKKKQEAYFQKWGEKQSSDLYNAQRIKYRGKKYNAIRSGYPWEIEFGDIKWNSICPILGIELDYFAENTQENSPSFDRVNNSIGYTKGNVQIVSWRANRIKNNGTAEEHRKIADYLDMLHTPVLDSKD